MSAQPCVTQPVFSTPNWPKNASEDILMIPMGIKNLNDNAEWMRQNRFALKDVGDQSQLCPYGLDLPYQYWLLRCMDMDVTSIDAIAVFKCIKLQGRGSLIRGWVPFDDYGI